MMKMRQLPGLLAVAVLAGCASAGMRGAAPLDPVGSYTLTTMIQGSPVAGQLRIRGEPGAYTGALYTDMTGELRIPSVTVEGNDVIMVADTPDGPANIRITFDGDSFTGSWELGPQGGSITGRRVSG